MTDIYLYNTLDKANVVIENGVMLETAGPEVAYFLSLFGGNEDDNGTEATKHLEYWGNALETEPKRKMTSRTQSLLRSLPATSANLVRLKSAVTADLAWAVEAGLVSENEISVGIPRLNWAEIRIDSSIVQLEYWVPWEV